MKLTEITGGQPLDQFVAERGAAAQRELQRAADAIIAHHRENAAAGIFPERACFLTSQLTEKVGRRAWRYFAPLIAYSRELRDNSPKHQDGLVVVPMHRVTDFASVPRVPIAYYLTGDTAHEESGPHDELCLDESVPRKLTDKVFREMFTAPRHDGRPGYEPAWRKRLMFKGVRLGAWWSKAKRAIGATPEEDEQDQPTQGGTR